MKRARSIGLVRRATLAVVSIGLAGALVDGRALAAAPDRHYDLGAETALDVRTRLEWLRSHGDVVPLADALLTCNNRAGGRWRVPSARELETIVDVRAVTAPTWDRVAFGGVSPNPPVFWTLTALPVASASASHVVVDFRPVRVIAALKETDLALVRCVRIAP